MSKRADTTPRVNYRHPLGNQIILARRRVVSFDGGIRMVQRPTTDVLRRAQAALSSSPIYVLREIIVERSGRSVVLSGCVDSFYHKQQAQELVRSVVGGYDVINVLEVAPTLAESAAGTG